MFFGRLLLENYLMFLKEPTDSMKTWSVTLRQITFDMPNEMNESNILQHFSGYFLHNSA